jgi:hypothetical protein
MASQLLSWIWAKLFGRASSARPYATTEHVKSSIEEWKNKARAMLANEANWGLVRESLGRLEGAGLRIAPTLDQDLIVARCLRNLANWCEGGDLATFFIEQKAGTARNSVDLVVFMDLADESDAF